MSDSTTQAGEFYTRWASLYDRLATEAPLVSRLRAALAEALGPNTGDVVVEMGCGTGANLPYFRERVGPAGTVIGVDVSRGVIDRARTRIEQNGWENVHLVRADATRPPVSGLAIPGLSESGSGSESESESESEPVPVSDTESIAESSETPITQFPPGAGEVDCIAASFVSGMLTNPGETVNRWAELLEEDGRLAVMDLARSTTRLGRVINPLFRVVVRAGSPPGTRTASGVTAMLDQRVRDAHYRVHERCRTASTKRYLCGFVRISAGTVHVASESGK